MERIAFDVVTPKKGVVFDISKSGILMLVGFVGLGFLLIFGAIFHKFHEIIILDYLAVKLIFFACLISILIGNFTSFGDYDGNDLATTSVLFFDENEITFDYTETFPLSEIAHIKFRIFDYKGVRKARSALQSLGADNYLEFKHEGEKHKFQFIIESERHMQLLTEKLIPILKEKTKVTY
ncbi:hypothetical protein [Kordia sp.]|uniref:hypothetical protein n=1 Tax=Kordia sp. TaxID=1965332 RepID=UPI003D2D9504